MTFVRTFLFDSLFLFFFPKQWNIVPTKFTLESVVIIRLLVVVDDDINTINRIFSNLVR